MKILGCVLLLLVSSNLFAGSWTHKVEEVTAASGDKGYIWTLASKHPDHDVTMVMKLVVFQNDPYRNEPESELNNGWKLEYQFGSDAHDPSDMESMNVRINWESGNEIPRKIKNRSVVMTVNTDTLDAIHTILDRGVVRDNPEPGDAEKREYSVQYITADTRDPEKYTWEQGVTVVFDMKDWDPLYHQVIKEAKSKGAGLLVTSSRELRTYPINRLPQNLQPKPSQMQNAAEKAGINIDAAYEMSMADLEKAIQGAELERLLAKKQEERDRLAAEKLARQKAEKAAAAKAEQELATRKDKANRALRNFNWPYLGCSRPKMPAVGASDYNADRANKKVNRWRDCMDNGFYADQRAIRLLIDELGGSWSVDGDNWSRNLPGFCDCQDNIRQLLDENISRHERRMVALDKFNDSIIARNLRQDSKNQSTEMWNGINSALDNMEADMNRMNQQRQNQWNNQIWVTPGYN